MKCWLGKIVFGLALVAGFTSCAATQNVNRPIRHVEIAVDASLDVDNDDLKSALEEERPAWSFEVSPSKQAAFNTLVTSGDAFGICLAPDRIYNEEGLPESYLPMVCGQIHKMTAAADLVALVDKQSDQAVSADQLDEVSLRNIVQNSTASDPVCYSYVPLWLVDKHKFMFESILAQTYMIACARNIDVAPNRVVGENAVDAPSRAVQQQILPSSKLSGWLRMGAALLTAQPDFIQKAFHSAAGAPDAETRVFGQALESHTEVFAEKWMQSQLTLASAFETVNSLGVEWLSDIMALMMFRTVSNAPAIDSDKFAESVLAVWPQHASVARLSMRYALVSRMCRLASMLGDVPPDLVEACLPAIDMAVADDKHEDYMDYVYLIEKSVTDKRHPRLTPFVQEWLKARCADGSCPWFDDLKRSILATPNLDEDTAKALNEMN